MIPVELQMLDQWVLVGANKEPIDPVTGNLASVTNPATWGSYSVATKNSRNGLVGFVLTERDPYCLIDIDDKESNPATPEQRERQAKVLTAFDSYTERSVSGTGYHIIIKGSIPRGIDQDHIGVYSKERYMIMTGRVVREKPINDYHDLVNRLYSEATQTSNRAELVDGVATLSDAELVEKAGNAVNGEKFNSLCSGYFSEYPSQSEADFALLSIIAFYTEDNEQVRRIFRMTALGKRDKAKRDRYLNDALSKIRAKQQAIPTADLSGLIAKAKEASLEIAEEPAPDIESAEVPFDLPPGLIGDLTTYFYQSAVRPVPEVALAAAIGIIAGVAGRSYNISGTGLNQYIILLARTGAGKEGALSGIESLLYATRMQVPMIEQFLGPAAFASGQALVKVLNERPCFVSVLGEFGLTLQQLSDSRANSASIMLRKVLLDLYAKSGWNRMLRSSVYSDTDKNTKVIQAPNVTILGESTPETFFDGLEASHVSEGLIPRFSVIEYKGPRPPRNRHAGFAPPPDLIKRFIDLVVVSQSTSSNNTCGQVIMDEEATDLMDAFDELADRTMNASHFEVAMQLWNRAHLKALKMAGLIAVGCNTHTPVVTGPIAQWAIDYVKRDINTMMTRFSTGDIGRGDSKQFNDMKRIIKNFFVTAPKTMQPAEVNMRDDGLITYRHILRCGAPISSFKNDRAGATQAIKKTLQALVDGGELVQVPAMTVNTKYKFSGVAYIMVGNWR